MASTRAFNYSRFVEGPFGAWQQVTSRCGYPQNGLSSGSAQDLTYRSRHVFEEDTPFVRLVYINSADPFATQVDTVTYKVGYDHVPASGVSGSMNSITPRAAYFNGANTVALVPGATGMTDAIFGPFKKGDELRVRTYVSVDTLGKKWPVGNGLSWSYEGSLAGDQTAAPNFSTAFTSAGSGVTPALILGPVMNRPSAVLLGDSIGDGSGDSATGSEPITNNGLVARACSGQVGLIKIVGAGRQAANEIAVAVMRLRGPFALQAQNVICAYGTNDVNAGTSLATIQANLITMWNWFANTGRRVFQTTVLPNTTSTDSWATTANQTVTANETVRQNLNTWLRAGAPMSAGAAVAVGTSGALIAGDSGHPLYKIWDQAALIEVNNSNVLTLNGGKWQVTGGANYATSDGIHPSRAAHIILSAAVVIADLTA